MSDTLGFMVIVVATLAVLIGWDLLCAAVDWLNDQGASIAPIAGPEDFA